MMSRRHQHPSPDPELQRHVRVYLGMLMNTEEDLTPALLNRQEAYQFAVAAYDALEPPAPGSVPDPVPREAWTQGTQPAMALELLERMRCLVGLVQTHAPAHPLARDYQASLARFQARYGSSSPAPREEGSPAPGGVSPSFDGTGAPLPRVLELYARCVSLPDSQMFVPWFTLFLAGLRHAITHSDARVEAAFQPGPRRGSASTWVQACEDNLRAAIAFAMQADPMALVRRTVRLPHDRAFHCLFVGIAYALHNPTPMACEWLERVTPQEHRIALFYAMGVLAAKADFAQRLVRPVRSHLDSLVAEHLGEQWVPLIAGTF